MQPPVNVTLDKLRAVHVLRAHRVPEETRTRRSTMCEHASKERYGHHVRNICTAGEQLRSSSLGGDRHGKKCHIILLYGDAQHALENLSSYTGYLHGAGRTGEIRKGISLIWYCGSYGTRATPGSTHPGWIANRRSISLFARDIFARVARTRTLYFRARALLAHQAEFISG